MIASHLNSPKLVGNGLYLILADCRYNSTQNIQVTVYRQSDTTSMNCGWLQRDKYTAFSRIVDKPLCTTLLLIYRLILPLWCCHFHLLPHVESRMQAAVSLWTHKLFWSDEQPFPRFVAYTGYTVQSSMVALTCARCVCCLIMCRLCS